VLYEILTRWLGDSPTVRVQATYLSWGILGACLQPAGDKYAGDFNAVVAILDDLAAGVIISLGALAP
jgi:hypothetical protein